MKLPETTVIGLGGLGTALVKTLMSHDIPVESVFNRSVDKAQKLSGQFDIPISSDFPKDVNQLGKLTFITVSDSAIREIADRLSELSDNLEGYIFVHSSGNESADLLDSLRKKGAFTASFHPLQAFTAQSGEQTFKDIYFSLQGDDEAFPILKNLAKEIGAHSFEATANQKSHLHAAAVMAANYLNTLLDASVDIGSLGGLSKSQVQKALLPLIQTTLKNAEGMTFAEALTGPIKRGDAETVKKHVALLKNDKELKELYCVLGKRTVKLAKSSGSIDGTTAQKLRKILHGANG